MSLGNVNRFTDFTAAAPALNESNCLGRTNKETKYSLESVVVLITLTSLFCSIALGGNFTVILAIIKDHVISKHKQHLYLLSLAVADAFLVVLVVPFSLTNELLGFWPFGDVYCRIYLSVDILLCTASICNICCIGIDRFVSVKYPTKYKKHRRLPRIKKTIAFIWFYAAVVSLVPFTGKTEIIQGAEHECFINDSPWFIILSSSLSFFLPACIIGPVYFKIFLIGRRLAAAKRARSLLSANAGLSKATNPLMNERKQSKLSNGLIQNKQQPNLNSVATFSSCSVYDDKRSYPHVTTLTHSTPDHIGNSSRSFQQPGGRNGFHSPSNPRESTLIWRYGNFLDVPEDNRRAHLGANVNSENNCETSELKSIEKQRKTEEAEREGLEIDFSSNTRHVPPVYVRKSPVIQHQLQEMFFEKKKKSNFSLLKLRCYNMCCCKSFLQPPDVVLAPPSAKLKAKDDQAKFKLWQASLQPSATKRKDSALIKRASAMSTLRLLGTSRREKRFIFIIFVVTGFFLLCWTPFFTTYIVYAICREACCIDQNMFKIFFWIGYLNSGINPVLYTIFNKDFRQAFKRLFRFSKYATR